MIFKKKNAGDVRRVKRWILFPKTLDGINKKEGGAIVWNERKAR